MAADEAVPLKKVSPDGQAVAIRTHFTDEAMHLGDATKSWLAVTGQGHTVWLTARQVTDWTEITP